MNLELLEEIHDLQKQDISDTEIANSLGMSKANMLFCLRMEKIISNKYENDMQVKYRLQAVNDSYLKQIESLKKDLSKKDKKINDLKSSGADDYLEEIERLKYDLEDYRDISIKYYQLKARYEDIPNFIKRLF